MNHSEAIQSNAAAAYLVGTLSEAERDAFEYHFIDCRICAKAVWTATAADVPYPEVVKSGPGKVIRFPVRWIAGKAVAAALAIVVGIQGYAIYLLRRPPIMEFMAPGVFITGTTRAGANDLPPIHFQGDEPVKVSVLIESETPYPSYRLELLDPSGKSLFVFHATDEQVRSQEGEALFFLLRPLPAGRYVLMIEGVRKEGNRLPIDSQVIVVQ